MSESGNGRPLDWFRVLGEDELPEGRVTTVTAGLKELALVHYEGKYAGARQPLPAPGRAARRGLDRERPAALPVARLRLRPADRRSPGLRGRGHLPTRSRSATTGSTSRRAAAAARSGPSAT